VTGDVGQKLVNIGRRHRTRLVGLVFRVHRYRGRSVAGQSNEDIRSKRGSDGKITVHGESMSRCIFGNQCPRGALPGAWP
jgi:hypothetical protein